MHRHFIQNSWHVRSPNRRKATLMWNVQRVKYHPKNQKQLPVRHRNKQLTRQKRVRTSCARTLRQRNVTHNSPKLKLSDLSAGGAKLNAALERLEMEKKPQQKPKLTRWSPSHMAGSPFRSSFLQLSHMSFS